ncbi:torsin-1A [Augochlora pura]
MMKFAGFVPICIVISFVTIPSKCESFWRKGLSSLYGVFDETINIVPCSFMECCNNKYISFDVNKLDDVLSETLYGQEIAHRVVISALRGHLSQVNPPKALVMSFHGPPGTGKTFVAQMIARSFYKKGEQSQYYHFFNGRNDFPLEQDVEHYKEELRKTIINSLKHCERSLFVFDEVDKMPEGVLNALVPFVDYNAQLKSWRFSSTVINTTKAVYIFLSNTGSSRIIQRLLTLWEEGKHRSQAKLQDFEYLISVGAFNEKGGLRHSDTIDTNLIDHYVPFLPLEEAHVKQCLLKAFVNRDIDPSIDMIESGISYVIFGPDPHNLYATSGCKRLEQKVAAIIYDGRKKKQNSEL